MTKELEYVKEKISDLGRKDKLSLLEESNLNDEELQLLTFRFVNGFSLKECSDKLGLEVDTINKQQHKFVKKLYLFITKV